MKKVVFSILSIVMLLSFCISLGFQDVSAESKAVSKPTSNVDSKTKQDIINKIKKSDVYKKQVKSRLLCKMLYNVFTISTYQN
ncbi:hypothetical protein [Staphylococcus chromogenes]|uniref:hypothetical protein n=1 Tax=Staphylococcus chromogenes TaxID=46126 RepID=UPI0028FDDB52|nr:hypothetical protein [Staphylococcus chromogenes]MDU0452248.1 hypothetical protein [Staphylococcus chromogenes]